MPLVVVPLAIESQNVILIAPSLGPQSDAKVEPSNRNVHVVVRSGTDQVPLKSPKDEEPSATLVPMTDPGPRSYGRTQLGRRAAEQMAERFVADSVASHPSMSGTMSFGPGTLRNVQEPERSIGIAPSDASSRTP